MEERVARLAAVFESALGAAADELARELGVVQRERKLTGSLLVQILVWSWWNHPEAHDDEGRPLEANLRELPAFLRSQTAGTTQIDQDIEIGGERFPCRLIAVRCGEELANRRRQKLRETCKRKGRRPSENQLTMCEWFVLITNVPRDRLSVNEACVAYRVRWQIELLFKCYKSDGGLDKSRARRGASRLVELMAKWLARLLEHALLAPTGGPLARTSWRARVRRAAQWVAELAHAIGDRRQFLDVLTKTLEHLKRLRPKAKRKTNPGTLDLLNNPKLLAECLS